MIFAWLDRADERQLEPLIDGQGAHAITIERVQADRECQLRRAGPGVGVGNPDPFGPQGWTSLSLTLDFFCLSTDRRENGNESYAGDPSSSGRRTSGVRVRTSCSAFVGPTRRGWHRVKSRIKPAS